STRLSTVCCSCTSDRMFGSKPPNRQCVREPCSGMFVFVAVPKKVGRVRQPPMRVNIKGCDQVAPPRRGERISPGGTFDSSPPRSGGTGVWPFFCRVSDRRRDFFL